MRLVWGVVLLGGLGFDAAGDKLKRFSKVWIEGIGVLFGFGSLLGGGSGRYGRRHYQYNPIYYYSMASIIGRGLSR